ncbi:MAG TPA: thiamine phosphate synthase [Polyangiaceae bacterium]|nr:thiamine phosphate synthase [Polyangiaceae bacterium]
MADVLPRLIVFSDTTRVAVPTLLDRFAALAERARPGSIQFTLRDYSLPLRERWTLAERLAELASRTGHVFAIAERADLARAFGCRAFHLPHDGLSASDARSYLGAQVAISRGCHDLANEIEPELDALLLSPIFEARKGRPALGLAALRVGREARPKVRWYALGGVEAGNAASCLAAGAAGVAVIGAALEADPEPLLSAVGILG